MTELKRDRNMTCGPILPQFIAFAMPLLAGLLFQLFYNTVDSMVVGRFVGTTALAAVNGTGSIINLVVSFSAGMSTGASVVISQLYGAKDMQKLSLAVHSTIGLTFVLGVVGTGLGIAIVNPMLNLMATPESVYGEAQIYLRIYFAGMLGNFIYNMGSGILRAVGDSRRPLYFLIVSALFNIAFDLLFVAVFHWGVAGTAYATIMAQFLSAILVLIVLTKEKCEYGLHWKKICLHRSMILRVLKIGLPAALQSAITCLSNVFVMSYINYFQAVAMAAWGCYAKIDNLLYIPIQAVSMTVNTFVGQNFGANQPARAKQGVKVSIGLCLAITAVLCLFVELLAEPLMTLFTDDLEVITKGAMFLRVLSPFYLMHVFNQMYASALRGIGKSIQVMIIMLCCFVGIRQIYLFVISRIINTEISIGLGYPVGWISATLVTMIVYHMNSYFRQKKKANFGKA